MEQFPTLTGLFNHCPDEDLTKSAKTLKSLKTDSEAEIIVVRLSALPESGHYGRVAVQDDPTLDMIIDQWSLNIFAAWDFLALAICW
jgi:hypothetical protein